MSAVGGSATRPLVALAGNPNVGKTTLFNALTGSRARVGNYPGVTVEKRLGQMELEGLGTVDVLDVPGTYSLVARTGEEQVALQAVVGLRGERRPDAVVVCVDSTALVRGLYLALQIQELGLPVLVALTMSDEAGPAAPDPQLLAQRLGCPVVAVVASRKQGLAELAAAIARRLADAGASPRWHWAPSRPLEEAIARVRAALPPEWPANDAMALWALMSIDCPPTTSWRASLPRCGPRSSRRPRRREPSTTRRSAPATAGWMRRWSRW